MNETRNSSQELDINDIQSKLNSINSTHHPEMIISETEEIAVGSEDQKRKQENKVEIQKHGKQIL